MGVRGYHQLVCAGLSESAATRRVFFTCGGGAPTSCDRRRQRTENIVTSLRSVPNEGGRQEEVFSILVVFFAVGTISGKSLKLLPAGVIFYSYNAPYSISAAGGAYSAPQTLQLHLRGLLPRGRKGV